MDGLYYATIARNLSNGLGDFWFLHFTNTLFPVFHEHPPLAIGMQSVFFTIIGESFYTERIYAISMFFISVTLIHQIWKEIVKEKYYYLSWIPLLLYVATPLTQRCFSDNILENTMSIFISLSVLFILKGIRKKQLTYIVISGVIIFFAFLSKGFTGLFTLSFFFWYYIIFHKISFRRMTINSIVLISSTIIPLVLLYFIHPPAIESIVNYLEVQVVNSINNIETVGNRFFIISILWMQIRIPLFLSIILILILNIRKYKKPIILKEYKWFLFFILIGISGVLPIIISLKQSSIYIFTTIPFFSIAFGILVVPTIHYLMIKEAISKFITPLGIIIFLYTGIACTHQIYNSIQYGHRDIELLEDIQIITDTLRNNTTISIDFNTNWPIHGYFARRSNISLDRNNMHEYHLTYKEGWSYDFFEQKYTQKKYKKIQGYNINNEYTKVDIKTNKLQIYKRNLQ